jgi:hypothetical protein
MVLMIIQNPEIHHQDNSSIRSKAASLLDAVSTTFQRSRTNSPVKKHFVGSPSPARSPRTIWGLATQFFIDKPLPNQPDDLNLHERSPSIRTSIDILNKIDIDMAVSIDPSPQLQLRATVEDVPDEDDEDLVEIEDEETGGKPTEDNEDAEDIGDLSENDDAGETDKEDETDTPDSTKTTYRPPPTVAAASTAYQKIKLILHPPRDNGKGYKDPKLDLLLRGRLEGMKQFLWVYSNPSSRTYCLY